MMTLLDTCCLGCSRNVTEARLDLPPKSCALGSTAESPYCPLIKGGVQVCAREENAVSRLADWRQSQMDMSEKKME